MNILLDPQHAQKKASWFFKNSHEFGAMRALVYNLLLHPLDHEWTIQGLGMMRTYIDSAHDFRLNVWDRSLMLPDVSVVHDHPWDFVSWVLNGEVRNTRYDIDDEGLPYDYMTIKCGIDGGPKGAGNKIHLMARPVEIYTPGDVYAQRANEIHSTYPRSASVTLNYREVVGNGDDARVFWHGPRWVDAKPRLAEQWEVERVAARVLDNWLVFDPGDE